MWRSPDVALGDAGGWRSSLSALADVASEAKVGKIETGGKGIVVALGVRQITRDFRVRKGEKISEGCGFIRRAAQQVLDAFEPVMQAFLEFGNVSGRVIGETVVGQK